MNTNINADLIMDSFSGGCKELTGCSGCYWWMDIKKKQ